MSEYSNSLHPPTPTFREVAQRVRRYRPSELLPALTAVSASVSFPKDNVILEWRAQAPWTMSALARECIVHGNEYREPRTVTSKDVDDLVKAFTASDDPQPLDMLDQVLGIFTRISYEQFPYQESDQNEISRSYAMTAKRYMPRRQPR